MFIEDGICNKPTLTLSLLRQIDLILKTSPGFSLNNLYPDLKLVFVSFKQLCYSLIRTQKNKKHFKKHLDVKCFSKKINSNRILKHKL